MGKKRPINIMVNLCKYTSLDTPIKEKNFETKGAVSRDAKSHSNKLHVYNYNYDNYYILQYCAIILVCWHFFSKKKAHFLEHINL